MDILSRQEVRDAIEGKKAPARPPLFYDFWIYDNVFDGDQEKREKWLSKYPQDIQTVHLNMPDLLKAPSDDPNYRWTGVDLEEESDKGLDARILIPDWESEEADKFFETFPDADYAGLIPEGTVSDGRYMIAHWWYALFERHWSLRGMEEALTDFYLYPDETHRLYQKLTDFYVRVVERACTTLKVDGFFVSDDLGTQNSAFFSVDIFREFFKPYYKQIIDKAHEYGAHFWLHSCGNIEAFLPEFIDIGLDVIHPIQKYTMEERKISERYGDKICILSGFDVQQIIPFGTPEEVRREIRTMIDIFYRENGRLMLTMGNGSTPDWKLESLEALYEEAISYGLEKGRKKRMTMGTCYYPEHWDKSLWAEDIARMQECGISVIRIAEFSWNKIEALEGEFSFEFFDEFLDLCLEKGMNVIFGTPSATPPAWLTEKYPEVLNAGKDGVLYRHGGRRHYNYNSPVYQKLVSRIVTAIASHYGKHKAIVGWQIDNELNCETSEFYSEADTLAFRKFLREKYVTLDALNEAWGTVFWNQTYTQWDQIYVPRPVLSSAVNPHMHLDYYRFVSDSTIRFCKMQADIIRRYCKKGDFITTNGMFWNVDNHRMTEECLDIYTYDCYPNFAYCLDQAPLKEESLKDRRWTKNLHEVRSVCRHFGIMEQQAGANGWTTRMEAPAPRPGQLKLWAMQSVAHGADFVSFFRWRTCTIGTEIYWHGILDYDNRDNRKLKEVKEFYRLFKSLDAMCGADYEASFAVLKDYDNVWDSEVDVWHERVSSLSEDEIFAASELSHTPYDVVYLNQKTGQEDLSAYKVIFYPHPVIMEEGRAKLLEQYVAQGGTLVIGCRSGYKDMRGHCVMQPQPGLLQPLTGTDVRDFTFVSPAEKDITASWDGKELDMPLFNDILTPLEGTRVLAVYNNGYYAGEAALTEHTFGKGRVLHLGSAFSRNNVREILSYTGVISPFSRWIDAPEGMEVVLRRKDNRNYLFVLNFEADKTDIRLKRRMCQTDTGVYTEGTYTMPAYGTAVFTWEDDKREEI